MLYLSNFLSIFYLIFVVDNIVQLHDINGMNLNTLFVIEKSKGATYFAIHTEVCSFLVIRVFFMCVCIYRR